MSGVRIAVFYGGVSAEREVSLGSGQAAAEALERRFAVDRFDIQSFDRLPDGLDPRRHVVFSTLHGAKGEDGTMQRLLDSAGVVYAGCDAESSARTFDKVETKRLLKAVGVPVAEEMVFEWPRIPSVAETTRRLGSALVVKPVDQGSSVGLHFCEDDAALAAAFAECRSGRWLIEPWIRGREATVGILDGEAMGVVEIRPHSGRFDYESKYTKGRTEYIAPAPFPEALTERIRMLATQAYAACGCRDYARVDLMVTGEEEPVFLEINTLPGLKETSLLPMSARVSGYNFEELLQKLVEPALLRYRNRYSHC